MKASGNLLPSLALLDQLQELHLDKNWFNGTLPPAFAYGFPALTSLRLDFNSLTVGSAAIQSWLHVRQTGFFCCDQCLRAAFIVSAVFK